MLHAGAKTAAATASPTQEAHLAARRQRWRRLRRPDSRDGSSLRHLSDGVHLERLQPGEEGESEAEVAGGEGSVQHQLQLV